MSDYRDDMKASISRTLFVRAWSDWQDEEGWPDGSPSGQDLMHVAPDAASHFAEVVDEHGEEWSDGPARLDAAAETIMAAIETAVAKAGSTDFDLWVDLTTGGAPHDIDTLAHYFTMAALGHGVSWSDDHDDHGIDIGYHEWGFTCFDIAPMTGDEE
jgi:hypothetical protein